MSGCAACGTLADPADRFCRRCGRSLASQTVTEAIPRQRDVRQANSQSQAATATMERPTLAGDDNLFISDPKGFPAVGRAEARRYGFPWGDTMALFGSLAVIISAVLDWGGPFVATAPKDISAVWLLDPTTPGSGPSLGLLVLFMGTLGALVALVSMSAPGFTFLRRAMGLITLMIPMAFALRTLQSLDGSGGLTELPSALGIGVTFAAAGALVQLAAPKRR